MSRRRDNGWPTPVEVGVVYTLHYDKPLGDPMNPRGFARHYTGFATERHLEARIAEHASGTCRARLCMAFHAAGIGFQVVAVEHGVTRERENQLKLRGATSRCPVCLAERAMVAPLERSTP
jgi:hypothetical protein